MGQSLVRYQIDQQTGWGLLKGDQVLPLESHYDSSLGALLQQGREALNQVSQSIATQGIPLNHVRLLNPVTPPARIIVQGPNYPQPDGEAEKKRPNAYFLRKDESALAGPNHNLVRPDGCDLLELGLHLGLVIQKPISGPVDLTRETLPDYLAGWTAAVDVTARDIALRQPDHQLFQAKSFRGFCPTGPVLYLPAPEEWDLLYELELRLWVNGEQRQQMFTRQWLFSPAETISQLSRQINLATGDLLLTGSEPLSSIKPPSGMMQRLGGLIFSEEKRFHAFVRSIAGEPRFLQNGDKIRASISHGNGSPSLGEQRYSVVPST